MSNEENMLFGHNNKYGCIQFTRSMDDLFEVSKHHFIQILQNKKHIMYKLIEEQTPIKYLFITSVTTL